MQINITKYFQPILLIGEDLENFIPELITRNGIKLELTSPDFIRISPEKEFAIADSRLLIKRASLSPLFSSHKILLAENFTKASIEAQNSLLKVLEEPPESTLIILLSQNKNTILPTVLSRIITIDYTNQTKKNTDLSQAENLIIQLLNPALAMGEKLMFITGYKDVELRALIKSMLISLNRSNLDSNETFLAKALLDITALNRINVRTRLALDNLIIAIDQLIKK